MRIQFEIFGEKQIDRDMMRLGERAADFTPAFRESVKIIKKEFKRNFATSGRHASGGWAPLAESTLKAKRAAGLDNGILRATRALERSLTIKTSDTVEIIMPHQFIFSSQVEYGKFHQTGTTTMPKRRPAELTNRARVEILKNLQRYVMTGKV